MNKYIKLLALSSGLLTAIAPTAIDTQKDNSNNDLNNTYQSIERMQNIIPKLSKVNYMLNIDIPDDKNSKDDNDAEDVVTFSTTDENGDSTQLSNEETLTYLDSALQETNAEYEQLKECLINAIKDTMDYLDQYKNNETELTNEQKLYIKEHSNSIKFLAETLENLSEELICVVDGCEDCDDEQFETNVSLYLNAINSLEERINVLQSSLSSLQLINNMANPYFYPRFIPKPNYVNSNDSVIDNDDNANDNNTDNNLNDNTTNTEQNDDNTSTEQDTTADIGNQEIDSDGSAEVEQSTNTADEDEKPTTFGLKSNIDTYAPTKRNIDTFFNTALYNDNYMYGNSYMPYGYGGGYSMPYGNGYMANPYGNGLNSNLVNRDVVENTSKQDNFCENCGTASVENNAPEDNKKTKKFRVKKAKNIDTYADVTVKSNINTMGESKISNFFKEKFNNLRNKIKNRKQNSSQTNLTDTNQDTITPQDNITDKETNNADININDDILVESQTIDKASTSNTQQPIEEKQIKAQ